MAKRTTATKRGCSKPATTLVRVSQSLVAQLREESLRTGVPIRALSDRALEQYLSRPSA